MKNQLPFILLMILCSTCGQRPAVKSNAPGLAAYYDGYFPIGVALSPGSFANEDTVLIKQEFNSITAENVMKMEIIHPEEDRYDWKRSDQLVAFAERNGLKIRGHALCWHEQVPGWMFVDDDGQQVSKKVLLQRLKTHIETVVGRYKGQIYAWDVVNEAVADESDRIYRQSPWYQICGEEFIAKAFEYAHAADPDARLFYNDYNADWPEKSTRISTMLSDLIDRGVPIHGMGMQGHWSVNNPSEAELTAALQKYTELGLEVQITELDVSIHPWEKERREMRADESDALTAEMARLQYEKYQSLFQFFRANKTQISGVTFWGLTDAHSWLGSYPVKGRRNYPLLFGHDGERKEVYKAVVEFE